MPAPKAFFYAPHPDDETLSMGLALLQYIASGYEVHLVSMNRGGNGGPMGSFNGSNVCNWANHAYTHDPVREGYRDGVLNVDSLGLARLAEARGALGAMSTIPPFPTNPQGTVTHHDANLPNAFGSSGGSSTLPPTAEGIALAEGVMQQFITDNPGSSHFTMSPTDKHADHAACGQALRNLKNTQVINVRHFVSKLYWDYSKYPEVKAQPGLEWYGTGSTAFQSRKSEYDNVLRTRVVPVFSAWNPAAGAYAIGYHQVVGQFNNVFWPATGSIANLWHS